MVAGSDRHAQGPAPGNDAGWLSAALALQVDHAGLPTAPGLIRLSQEQHCDDAHGPAYRPDDAR